MKTITLDAPIPAFLSLTNGANPVQDFTIDYTWSNAVIADIAIHTVPYSVVFTEYTGITSAHTGSFTFEIQCPDTPDSVTVNTGIQVNSYYDIAS